MPCLPLMNRNIQNFTLLVLLLWLAMPAANAQENYQIGKISFAGNDSISSEQLLDALTIAPSSLVDRKLLKKEPSVYSAAGMEGETERLQRLYQRQGFLSASITYKPIDVDPGKQRLNLLVQIIEGEAYRIDSLGFALSGARPEGLNADSVFSQLAPVLALKTGGRFIDESLAADISALRLAFQNSGYFYAAADYKLTLRPDSSRVSVRYLVNPGPKTYFGQTSIRGTKHVSDAFIRKQFEWKQGQPFRIGQLDQTRKDMYKLQLFSILSIQPQSGNAHDPNIPVNLFVAEARRFDSKYGVGYGTEDRFRAFAELTYKGFLGGARRLNLKLKHSALTPYDVNLSWIQPQFFSKKLAASLNPFITRVNEPGYDIRNLGANLKLAYSRNDMLTLNSTYYYERVKQYRISSDTTLVDYTDLPYNKSGIVLSAVFDNSTPLFTPQKGFNVLLAWKINGYLFGSDFDYNRVWTDLRHYQTLGPLVLASRLMLGTSISKSTGFIPTEDRFYAGGSNSVRGWQHSMLGPVSGDGVPLGGKSVLQGSLELRIPLVWKLSVVTFIDFGNVWADRLHYHLHELNYASGGGLRFDTPIGPVRFDVGLPVWNEKRSPEFFISVGQAF
ncbi:MAG: outer membrane protein assembly factor [Mangrovibacterium sp.]